MCYIFAAILQSKCCDLLLVVFLVIVFLVVLQHVLHFEAIRQLHSQSVVTDLLLVVFLVVFLVVLNMQESLVFAKTSLERMISAPSFYPLCRTSCATLIGNAMRLI